MSERLTPGIETGGAWNKLVNKVQQAYERNRAPEMQGTPKVSPPFFDLLREGGPIYGSIAAMTYLVEREKELGAPGVSPVVKAGANIIASAMLSIGLDSKYALPLLFYAQGDGGGGGGGGRTNEDWWADIKEAMYAAAEDMGLDHPSEAMREAAERLYQEGKDPHER
ncbi:MAG: hypothetical protein QXX08_06340 [Candidatus Bathyarchaeia archaeon]